MTLGEQGRQLALEALEIGGAVQRGLQRLRAEDAGGQGFHHRRLTAAQAGLQHQAAAVIGVAGEAVGFGGAAAQGAAIHLLEAMPVAEGDVVDLLEPERIEPQQVAGAGGVLVVAVAGAGIVVGGGEGLDRAVGEHQAGLLGRQGLPVELAPPRAGWPDGCGSGRRCERSPRCGPGAGGSACRDR